MVGKIFGLTLLFVLIGYGLGNVIFGLLVAKIKKINVRAYGSGNVGATNISRILGKKIGIMVLTFDMFKGWLSIFLSSIIYQTLGYKIIVLEYNNIDLYKMLGVLIYISGIFTIMGHCFPIVYIFVLFKTKFDFLKAKEFSGGKGAASTAGVFTAISPWIFLICFLLFVVIFLSSRYVSLSSMIAISFAPILLLVPQLDYFYILNIANINPILDIPYVTKASQIVNIIGYKNNLNWQYILTTFIITNLISLIVVYKHKDNIKRLITNTEKHLFEWKSKNNTLK